MHFVIHTVRVICYYAVRFFMPFTTFIAAFCSEECNVIF
jgi:hypothetical protein